MFISDLNGLEMYTNHSLAVVLGTEIVRNLIVQLASKERGQRPSSRENCGTEVF